MADASRDGNGTFNRVYDWTDDAANSIPITASRFDEEMDGVANELTNSVAADGQTTMSGALKMGGQKITGAAAGTALTDVPIIDQITDNALTYLGTTAGTASDYTLTPSPAITGYVAGMTFSFLTNADNTLNGGDTSLAISGLAAIDIKRFSTAGAKESLEAGDLKNGLPYSVFYDGTNFVLLDTTARYLIPSSSATVSGLVELATDAEFVAGTDTARAITAANVRNGIGFSETYDSGNQAITLGGALTLPHGLAAAPKFIQYNLRCATTQHNYSVGDIIQCHNNDAVNSRGFNSAPDATNINVRIGTNAPYILDKTTGVGAAITAGSWNLIVRAWG